MIQWPSDFISDLARRRTVLFLGSGISRNAANPSGKHPKTWSEFLDSITAGINPKQHVRSLLKGNDYLTACEVIKRTVGRDKFNQTLKDEYLIPGYLHASIHEIIFRLDARVVATPNFDKIYETYANHAAHGSLIVKHHYDPDIAETLRGTDRVILKIHGTIDSPDRMIFTRREYAEARTRYQSFYALLEALALTHTFVFLGCGLNDPDIRLLLEDTFFRHPSARAHIFVLPNRGLHVSVKRALEESMNLRILGYNPAKDHAELSTSLEQLVEVVEEERELIRRTGNW